MRGDGRTEEESEEGLSGGKMWFGRRRGRRKDLLPMHRRKIEWRTERERERAPHGKLLNVAGCLQGGLSERKLSRS